MIWVRATILWPHSPMALCKEFWHYIPSLLERNSSKWEPHQLHKYKYVKMTQLDMFAAQSQIFDAVKNHQNEEREEKKTAVTLNIPFHISTEQVRSSCLWPTSSKFDKMDQVNADNEETKTVTIECIILVNEIKGPDASRYI